jgi:nucleoid-associated protein YgaU
MWKKLKKNFDSTDSLISLALGLAVVLVIGMTIINYAKSKTQVATSTSKQVLTTKSAQTSALPTKYVIKAGDSLWSIAEQFYKSGYNWVDLQKANNIADADVINTGSTIIVPVVTPIVPKTGMVSSTAAPTPKEKSYTVVHGDDLWNIALREYGSGYKWVDIAKANNLVNPGIIHAGNVLKLQ